MHRSNPLITILHFLAHHPRSALLVVAAAVLSFAAAAARLRPDNEILDEIERVLAELLGTVGHRTHLAGAGVLHEVLNQQTIRDSGFYFGLTLAEMALLLWLSLRSWNAVAVAETIRGAGRLIVLMPIHFVLGFSVLAVSGSKFSVYFGILAGLAVGGALLADLLLLPALLLGGRGDSAQRTAAWVAERPSMKLACSQS